MRSELIDLLRCPRSGSPLRLVAVEVSGDEVEAGILEGDGGQYPIVAGIPVLRGGDDDVVTHLLGGDVEGATALAIGRDVPLSRLGALVPLLLDLRPTRGVGRWLERRLEASATRAARSALDASDQDPDPLLRLTHLHNRHPNAEGYNYFRYRLGLPRHLVALGAVAATRPGPGPVLEVGCGAGHLTWQMARMLAPRRVVAVDRELDLLWISRHHLAPEADHVCADVTSLPFADTSFSLGTAFDVLSFVDSKAGAVRELRRVLAPPQGLVLSSLINASVRHEFAGAPLPVSGWCRLVEGLDHVALTDREVLTAYLDGRTPPGRSSPDADLVQARTITLLSGESATAGLDRPLDGWPHAIGRWGPHPLLRPAPDASGALHRRRWSPSPGFARDNADLDLYLPDELVLSAADLAVARAGQTSPAVAAALSTVALIGYPDRWPVDPL